MSNICDWVIALQPYDYPFRIYPMQGVQWALQEEYLMGPLVEEKVNLDRETMMAITTTTSGFTGYASGGQTLPQNARIQDHPAMQGLEPGTLEFKVMQRRIEINQGIRLLRQNLAQTKAHREQIEQEYKFNIDANDRQRQDIESDIAFLELQAKGLPDCEPALPAETTPGE